MDQKVYVTVCVYNGHHIRHIFRTLEEAEEDIKITGYGAGHFEVRVIYGINPNKPIYKICDSDNSITFETYILTNDYEYWKLNTKNIIDEYKYKIIV